MPSCRARKIKCNEVQPTCQNCVDSFGPCIYATSRKDRLKTATKHIQDLAYLLQELRPGASHQEKQKIDDMLASATEDIAEAASTLPKRPGEIPEKAPNFDGEDEDEGDGAGEANVTVEFGSREQMDSMNENLLRNMGSRASGYVGKNSEVQWLRGLHYKADSARSDFQGPYEPPGNSAQAHDERIDTTRQYQKKDLLPLMSTNSCSFYPDEDRLDIDVDVDPYEMPPYEMAKSLLKCYMQTVQNSFPILSQKLFTKQFWHAMLNLVFAIGAVHSHLTETDWSADEKDHLLYHNRAWALSLNDPWWLTHPDLAQMQITALLSFYYMAIGHINRSWVVIGMSIRFGFALGLHIRNEDRTATVVKKEILSRMWWAVYSLDRTLSAVTGRPSVGAEIHFSTTLPLPISANDIDEAIIEARYGREPKWDSVNTATPSNTESSHSASTVPPGNAANTPDAPHVIDAANAGTFLIAIVKLGIVSSNVLTQLYSPNLVTKPWKDIQGSIARLAEDLDAWLYSLPKGLDPFTDNGRDRMMQQERNILKTYYYSTKILICRPCLCRLDRRIRSQTQSSVNFDHQIAAQCVAAAKSIAACLPDDMAVWRKNIYKIFPWWAVVHYLMQPIVVLLLEACYEAHSISVMPTVKKLVRWLRELSSTNRTAERAYSMMVNLLEKMVSLTFKDPQTTQEITLLLSEHPSLVAPDVKSSQFDAQWLTSEDIFEQHPLPHHIQSPDEAVAADTFGDTMPAKGVFPGAADLPVSGFSYKELNSHSPLANMFPMWFDQYNPLQFDDSDVYMQDAPEQE